jgi:hypothetical protein
MSLKDLKLPHEEVKVPGGDKFAVRGLSLADIMSIVRKHRATVSALFDRYASVIEGQGVSEVGRELLEAAPDVAADVIAHASGDPDAADVAARLPFPVQLDAIEKIGRLTFEAEGGPKKVLETVIRVLQGTTNFMADLRSSTSGLPEFEPR